MVKSGVVQSVSGRSLELIGGGWVSVAGAEIVRNGIKCHTASIQRGDSVTVVSSNGKPVRVTVTGD